jgi:hypothetical protein
MQSLINNSIIDIESKITTFKGRNKNKFWNSISEPNFFKIINTVDSIKDGANTQLAQKVFNDEAATGITPDDFKSNVKELFANGVTDNSIRKIPYSRIKGDKNQEKHVTCEFSFYDCGLTPEKVAKDSRGRPPGTKVTIGNKIDTGPSNTGSTVVNFPTDNDVYTFDIRIMKILGYKDTELSFINKSICNKLVLFGKNYSEPAKALNSLAVGNDKKSVILSSGNKLETADKAGYLYYKSLGDKLIAYCYYLFCKQNTDTKCLFTCDIFVAFFAYLFGNDFVYNENDKMPKITNVFYKTTVNYRTLSTTAKTEMLKEYTDVLKDIDKLMGSNRTYYFSGDTKTYNSIQFLQNVRSRLVLFKDELNGLGAATNVTSYADMRKYKLQNLFNIQKTGDYTFITSRWQICVADTQGFGKNTTGKPHTLRSLINGMSGGALVRLDDETLDPPIYSKIPVEPKSGGDDYYDFLVEYNLFLFVTKAYNTLLSKLRPVDKGVIEKYFDMTTNIVIDNPSPPVATTLMEHNFASSRPYVIYYNAGIHTVDELYNYGHIYDVMTYHFFAEPDYEDYNIIQKIIEIFNFLLQTREFDNTNINNIIVDVQTGIQPPPASTPASTNLLFPTYEGIGSETFHRRCNGVECFPESTLYEASGFQGNTSPTSKLTESQRNFVNKEYNRARKEIVNQTEINYNTSSFSNQSPNTSSFSNQSPIGYSPNTITASFSNSSNQKGYSRGTTKSPLGKRKYEGGKKRKTKKNKKLNKKSKKKRKTMKK